MLTTFDLAAVVFALAAVLAFLNLRFFRLPSTIAMLVAGLVGAIMIVAGQLLFPDLQMGAEVTRRLADVNFSRLLMDGMLGFLLFAGALTVDGGDLRKSLAPVLTLATAGVLISTLLIGLGSYVLFPIAGTRVPLVYCFVFGALISPTDPVAVLALMEELHVPKSLQIYFTGESLLNDGVGIVVFTVFLAIASSGAGVAPSAILLLFVREVIGGCLLGLAGGYVVYLMTKAVDEPNIEVQLSFALVTSIIAAARHLHISGPLACVVAGIFIGNEGRRHAMRDATKEALDRIWSFADHVMNAILFLLLGLEATFFGIGSALHAAMIATIVLLAIVARLVSVGVPISMLRRTYAFPRGMVRMLTWGGLRGGISVALALSLPVFQGRNAVLNATYMIVIFTIIAQGLTIPRLVRHFTQEMKTQ